MFFMVPFAPLPSLLIGLATWAVLALLNQLVIRRFLENATAEPDPDAPAEAPPD